MTTREPTPLETAASIADTLQETDERARKQITYIVWALGRTQARALLQQTLDIEASGGLMLPNGSRRRTPGGVFFHLVYTTGQPKEGHKLKRPQFKKPGQPQLAQKPVTETPAPVTPLTWDDRPTVIQEAEDKKGTANVKITLVGRPGKIVDRDQCIVTVMESNRVPALPKGLPTPPAVPTKYTVYIGAKQWKNVAEVIQNPEDTLIIEGFPTMDKESESIAVFATNTTTKHLQMAQREAQKAKSDTVAS